MNEKPIKKGKAVWITNTQKDLILEALNHLPNGNEKEVGELIGKLAKAFR